MEKKDRRGLVGVDTTLTAYSVKLKALSHLLSIIVPKRSLDFPQTPIPKSQSKNAFRLTSSPNGNNQRFQTCKIRVRIIAFDLFKSSSKW
jgi:hypothetical protein